MPVSLGECQGVTDTGQALLVKACPGNKALDHCENKMLWIPKSVLADENEVEEFEKGELFVRTWWAQKEGLE